MKDQPDKLVLNGQEKARQTVYYEYYIDLVTTSKFYCNNVKEYRETLRPFHAVYGVQRLPC